MALTMTQASASEGPPRFSRRHFIKLAAAGVAAAGACTVGGGAYALFLEPNWAALERVEVRLRGLPERLDGFTITQLSDLHRGPQVSEEQVSEAVALTLQQQPDLVALTGDFVSGSAGYAMSCAEALHPLIDHTQVFACLGNHDHWTDAQAVDEALTGTGVTVLRNSCREVADGLWIAAVDDIWEQHNDLDRALEGIPDGAATVLLAH
ncbi:MAG: hypothetical protein E3J64_02990, partial [Anaerolineales bacterium]